MATPAPPFGTPKNVLDRHKRRAGLADYHRGSGSYYARITQANGHMTARRRTSRFAIVSQTWEIVISHHLLGEGRYKGKGRDAGHARDVASYYALLDIHYEATRAGTGGVQTTIRQLLDGTYGH